MQRAGCGVSEQEIRDKVTSDKRALCSAMVADLHPDGVEQMRESLVNLIEFWGRIDSPRQSAK